MSEHRPKKAFDALEQRGFWNSHVRPPSALPNQKITASISSALQDDYVKLVDFVRVSRFGSGVHANEPSFEIKLIYFSLALHLALEIPFKFDSFTAWPVLLALAFPSVAHHQNVFDFLLINQTPHILDRVQHWSLGANEPWDVPFCFHCD